MKLDFNKNLKDLDGTDIAKGNMGKLLANNLISVAEGDAMKHYEWALKLNAGEVIDLDTSDQEYLKGFINKSQSMTVLAKAQLLKVMVK